jgi:hypothetical protein
LNFARPFKTRFSYQFCFSLSYTNEMAAKRTSRSTMGRCVYQAQTATSELVSYAPDSDSKDFGLGHHDSQSGLDEKSLRTLVELLARSAAAEFLAGKLDVPSHTPRPAGASGADNAHPADSRSRIK